ncbi:MAG: heavy metal translocating P-type ATPase [Deltaproteobacteria bacterium]|jgi:Cd2+/Zn2+-exporting ATPase|nr:heavy metal translocating P-type ATPase [Deltaproteobacteria bacterium]
MQYCTICGTHHHEEHPHFHRSDNTPINITPAGNPNQTKDASPKEGCAGEASEDPPGPKPASQLSLVVSGGSGIIVTEKPSKMNEEKLGLNSIPILPKKANAIAAETEDSCSCCSRAVKPLSFTAGDISTENINPPLTELVRYNISDMCCPVEEKIIRKKLEAMEGIKSLEFNLLNRVLTIHHSLPSLEPVEKAINDLGMTPVLVEDEPKKGTSVPEFNWVRLIVAAVVALASELCHLFFDLPVYIPIALAVAAILLAGFSTYKTGILALTKLNLNMNALMSFAVTGAVIIGDYSEAAMVMVLFTLAEALEDLSLFRARQAITGLMDLAPEKATIQAPDGSFVEAEAAKVPIGARVRVRPGEKLSLDGRILTGSSTINEAPITGESIAAEKMEGDLVYAGTINESGSFEYEVTVLFQNSTLARILKAVEEAQATKAPMQRFVDRFSVIYTPAVFLVALLIGTLPPLFWGEPWLTWIYRALVTLVIACPCALVISTPVTIVSGLAAATRKGILVKGGTFLEEGKNLNCLALDKTGTITEGKPVLTDMVPLSFISEDDLRILGGSLAERSDHPVSRAIYEGSGITGSELLEVTDFKALPGEGTSGTIGGRTLYLGNLRLVKRMGVVNEDFEKRLEELEGEGKSVVALFTQNSLIGLFAARDAVRPDSREALEELSSMGIKTIMLTGDNESAANAVASQIGGLEYRFSLLPEEKMDIIESLSKTYKVGMVGDGINDAPALAKADIGFAMGAKGTDTAIETADVALMDDSLKKIPAFVKLSRQTGWHLWENIVFSLVVKLAFLVFTFFGFTQMWMAIFADLGVCLLVVANGLRLLKK